MVETFGGYLVDSRETGNEYSLVKENFMRALKNGLLQSNQSLVNRLNKRVCRMRRNLSNPIENIDAFERLYRREYPLPNIRICNDFKERAACCAWRRHGLRHRIDRP